jgi:hypothetical protein
MECRAYRSVFLRVVQVVTRAALRAGATIQSANPHQVAENVAVRVIKPVSSHLRSVADRRPDNRLDLVPTRG